MTRELASAPRVAVLQPVREQGQRLSPMRRAAVAGLPGLWGRAQAGGLWGRAHAGGAGVAAVGPCTEGPGDSAARAHVVWVVVLDAVAVVVSTASHSARAGSGVPFQPMVTCKLGGGTGVAVSSVQQPS